MEAQGKHHGGHLAQTLPPPHPCPPLKIPASTDTDSALTQVLDPALTRPGRLSRKVVVPLPDEGGRADILGVHLRPTPMLSPADKEFCRNQIARITRASQLSMFYLYMCHMHACSDSHAHPHSVSSCSLSRVRLTHALLT